MNLKKRTAALLTSAVCLLSAGCASEESSSQKDISSQAVTAATPAVTSEPDTTTTVSAESAAEPDLNGSFKKEFEGISLDGKAEAVFRRNDGTAAVKCTTDKEGSIYIFDAVTGKIARTVKTEAPYDKLLGVLKDGSVITQKPGERVLLRYDEGSDEPARIELDYDGAAIFTLDADNECIYANGDSADELVKISLSDNKTTTVKYDGVYSLRTPLNDTGLIGAAEYDERGTKLLPGVYSTETGKRILSLHKRSQMLYSTKDTVCEIFSDDRSNGYDVNINTYSIEDQKYLCTYTLSNELYINQRIFADKDSDKLLVSLGNMTPMGADIEKLAMIDLTSGKAASLDSVLNENSVNVEACTVGTKGYWLIAVTDTVEKVSNTRLVMLDPVGFSYDTELKKEADDADENIIIKCGENLAYIRSEADRIEQKYNVRILIGDEIKNLDPDHIVSTEDDPDYNAELLMDDVRNLDTHLSRYPEGFFDHFRNNGNGGMTIALVGEHQKISDSDIVAAGRTSFSSDRYLITIDSYTLEAVWPSIDHEIWHAVDFLLENKGNKTDDEQWGTLNPPDFKYLRDYVENESADDSDTVWDVIGREIVDYNIPYFARGYGTVNELEDRATLIEEIYRCAFGRDFDDPKEGYAELCRFPHIKAKIDFLAQASEKVFGCVYWEKAIGSAPIRE